MLTSRFWVGAVKSAMSASSWLQGHVSPIFEADYGLKSGANVK